MERKSNEKKITFRVPKSLAKNIEKIVESSKYMSKSDFVRQAVREKLDGNEG